MPHIEYSIPAAAGPPAQHVLREDLVDVSHVQTSSLQGNDEVELRKQQPVAKKHREREQVAATPPQSSAAPPLRDFFDSFGFRNSDVSVSGTHITCATSDIDAITAAVMYGARTSDWARAPPMADAKVIAMPLTNCILPSIRVSPTTSPR
eukprot:CAMPEP_0197530762 /NCGR_PEP_ID=MMETSP1318-20131121/32851_1 /TAXON_ID=552666 /ORGANISM="Partenskyella glossopodia, Strain RCC365" /LENGTH=149 /DNA_ID=CAMNT_0043086727 /DNA_START=552 /DNA_END=1001 /DNA_ORIENTATION=-